MIMIKVIIFSHDEHYFFARNTDLNSGILQKAKVKFNFEKDSHTLKKFWFFRFFAPDFLKTTLLN